MEKKSRQDGDPGADTQEAHDVFKERAVAATRKHVRLQNTSEDTVHVISKYPGRMHTNDLHATLLALMGLDHERLAYRYAGRDFRLTDVASNVTTEILA
jgi:hypothetical protein